MMKFTKSAIAAAIVLSMSGFAMAAEGVYGASVGADGNVTKTEAFGSSNTIEITEEGIVVNAAGVSLKNKDSVKAYGAFTNILNPNAPTNLINSVFTGNSSENAGGGATIWADGNNTQVITNTISNSVFSGNSAANKGGALAYLVMEAHEDQLLKVTDSSFTNNQAGTITDGEVSSIGTGGAIHAEDDLTIDGSSSFTGNKATGLGGAVYVTGAGVTLTVDATDKTDVINFADNIQNYGSDNPSSNDIYLAANNKLNLQGLGKIELLSGLASATDSAEAEFSADQIYIADASGFLGKVSIVDGTTTVAGDQYFAGKVVVKEGGSLQSDDLQIVTSSGTTVKEGGQLLADSITLGKAAVTTSSPTTQAVNATLTVGKGGEVATGDLTFVTAASKLEVQTGGELEITGNVTGPVDEDGNASALTNVTNAGTIYTDIANLITSKTEGTTTTWAATAFGAALAGDSGKVVDQSFTGTYDHTDFTALEQLVGNVELEGATLVSAEDGQTTPWLYEAKIVGNVGKSLIAYDYSNASDTLDVDGLTFGAITFEETGTADAEKTHNSYTLTAKTNVATIRGDKDGNVFVGTFTDDDGQTSPVAVTLDGKFNFGKYDEQDGGIIDNDLTIANGATVSVEAGTFTFNGDLTLNADLTVKDTAYINGVVAQDGDGVINVEGGVVVDAGYKPNIQPRGNSTVGRLFAGVGEISAGGLYVAGSDYEAAAREMKSALTDRYQAFAERQSGYTGKSVETNMLYIGGVSEFTTAPTFGGSSDADTKEAVNVIAVDLGTLAASGYDPLSKVIISSDNQDISGADVIALQNLNNKVLTQNDNGVWTLYLGNVKNTSVDFGTSFYKENALTDGVVTFEVDEVALQDVRELGFHSVASVEDSLYNVRFDNGIANTIIFGWDQINEDYDRGLFEVASKSGLLKDGVTYAQFAGCYESENWMSENLKDGALKDYLALLDSYDASFVGSLVEAEHTVTNLATMGGAFSVGFDINDQIRNTIDRRSSLANLNVARNATGITPWVDVMGTWNTADGLYGSSGYEADIYGATLGADYTASCGAILGAAISIGQADANSVDASTKVDNDVDFWGVSFYGSHRIGNVNGKFDIGYVSTSNDLSANAGYFGHVKESLDADIFTVGLGAEYLATVGSLNVVPHAGIRWSSLDMDDSKYGADYDKMNLFQMPIGVAFSGTFDMTGWKVAPMLDISVVPTFGDKDAVASYTGGIKDTVRVVDSNPVQMTLGVNATVDAWTLGVNYGLSAGSDERLNNAFNFNARYTF